jgi:hypothetical protein
MMTSSTHASTPLPTRINHSFQHRTEREQQPFRQLATSGMS